MGRVRLALARTFLDSFSALPKKQQKKAREFTARFEKGLDRGGLNFERIEQAADPKVRSARIDQTYRAILVEPPKGDVFLCVWVDHHDEAYRWAMNKTFEVNDVTGTLQVFSVEEGIAAAPTQEEPSHAYRAPRLFDAFDEEELLLAGVPRPLLKTVQSLRYDHELDDLAPHLPEDAAEMLYLLAAGYGFMEALEEASRPKECPSEVDVQDFEKALTEPVTQRQFHVVEGEDELEAMLDEPLEQWRLFLHPSQRQLVRMNANGPVRVLGGAGTGKTVVLMHRARHLVRSVFTHPDDRLLVTTFTRNLAIDLEQQLGKLCGPDAARIEVKNIHAWARSLYESAVGHKIRVVPTDRDRLDLMADAVARASENDLTPAFYLEEWDQVVQAQDVETRDDYFHARRVGRGTRLGRKQRAQVWPVLEAYRELLQSKGLLEWQDVVREARLHCEQTNKPLPYRAVLVDEVQDFTPNELRLLRALVPPGPNDLFVVGDAHQRIYNHMTRLGSCGIDIRGRGRRLRINYRTTEQIRNHAVAILEGLEIDDLDGGVDSLRGYRSLRTGPEPAFHLLPNSQEEEQFLLRLLTTWLEEVPPESICIAARTNALVRDRYASILTNANLPHTILEPQEPPRPHSGIRLATMHRLKGLEFPRIILASVNEGVLPLQLPSEVSPDEASRADHEQRERSLFYVASTRARDQLCVLAYGSGSPWLSGAVQASASD